jgi:hypothetical protein
LERGLILNIHINEGGVAAIILSSLFLSMAISIFGISSCQKETDKARVQARQQIMIEGVKKGIRKFDFDNAP